MGSTDGANERPDWACLLCPPAREGQPWRPADRGYTTCSGCLDRLRELLSDIVKRWRQLDAMPQGAGIGNRGSPGFGSRSPASDHIIVMLDVRSSADAHVWVAADGRVHRESEHPPLSVFSVLDTIVWDIAEQREVAGPKPGVGVPDLGRWIDRHLDWLTRQRHVGEVAEVLRRLLAQLKPVTGDPRTKVGVCPNTLDEAEHTRECGAPLYAPTTSSHDDSIACGACKRKWRRSEWLNLGELLQAS